MTANLNDGIDTVTANLNNGVEVDIGSCFGEEFPRNLPFREVEMVVRGCLLREVTVLEGRVAGKRDTTAHFSLAPTFKRKEAPGRQWKLGQGDSVKDTPSILPIIGI